MQMPFNVDKCISFIYFPYEYNNSYTSIAKTHIYIGLIYIANMIYSSSNMWDRYVTLLQD